MHGRLESIASLHTRRGWLAFLAITLTVMVGLPLLNLLPPAGGRLHLPDFLIPLLGKFFCYGIVALAMDLIWGYVGVLSLGHGVFFALGGYAMGMHLMRSIGTEGVYRSKLPDFMVFLDWKELPWYWQGFDHFWFAALMALLVPTGLAYVFGFFAFRSRIRGVYFSIITQALTFAMMLLFFRNNTGFGGNNGLTDFKRLLGFSLHAHSTKVSLYLVSGAALALSYLACRFVVSSKLGRLLAAIRDAESRIMFSGYNPLDYKLFAWTLSALLCGLAGALYVPQVGIINPGEMQPSNSIEMAIWVAVGGRGTLVGPLLGALLVNGAKSVFTVVYPEAWLFLLGGLFIGVTLFLPRGLLGLFDSAGQVWRRARKRPGPAHNPRSDDEPAATLTPMTPDGAAE
jgi:urea transport system permease protein